MSMKFLRDDGGREAAGYSGRAGDCVCRAIAIAANLPYQQVYDALSEGMGSQRRSKHAKTRSATARNGVYTHRKWFKEYMRSLGFVWTATMHIGSGCKVHLTDGELPMGRLVVAVSKHYTAVIDGVIHDTYSPERNITELVPNRGQSIRDGERLTNDKAYVCSVRRRCVYGWWKFIGTQQTQTEGTL